MAERSGDRAAVLTGSTRCTGEPVVRRLASDEAGFLTGTPVVVDGGRTAVVQDDALPDYAARQVAARSAPGPARRA